MYSNASRFYSRIFAVVTAAILGLVLYKIVQPFLGVIAWALLAAFLMHPAQVRLARLLRQRRSLASGLLTTAAFLICIGPLAALGVAFVRQTADLLETLQQRTKGMAMPDMDSLQRTRVIGGALDWMDAVLGVSPAQMQGWIMSGTQSLLKYFASTGGAVFLGALGTVVGFAMMLFLLFFFLRDGASMLERMVRLIPMTPPDKQKLELHLSAVTRAVVFGTLLTALIQGALVGVSFMIVGLPSPVVFAVLAAVLSLLPVGGTAFVWVPAAIFLGAQGRWGAAIFMTIWGTLLVGLVDNIVKPMLISGRAEVPTLATFIGVLGGLAAFGAVGMFLGPILLALTLALLRYAEENTQFQ